MKNKSKKVIHAVVATIVVLTFVMPVSATVACKDNIECDAVANRYPRSESIAVELDTTSHINKTPELSIGRVWLRGLLFRCNRIGDTNHAMALRLHYIEITPTERAAGIVTMNKVAFKDGGRMYEVGAGLFTYVIGFFEGGLEIL